jgi:hypothetical protein
VLNNQLCLIDFRPVVIEVEDAELIHRRDGIVGVIGVGKRRQATVSDAIPPGVVFRWRTLRRWGRICILGA